MANPATKKPIDFHLVIPHFRGRELLEQLLQSIHIAALQVRDWPGFQCRVWVVNDSPEVDLSGLLVSNSYAFNLQITGPDKNRGVAEARNFPLAQINRGFIAWIDQDDVLLPDYFTTLLPQLRTDSVLLLNAVMKFNGKTQQLYAVAPPIGRSTLSWYNPIRTPGMLVFPVEAVHENRWKFRNAGRHGGSDDWAFHFQWMGDLPLLYESRPLLLIHRGTQNVSRDVQAAFWSRWSNTGALLKSGKAPLALWLNAGFRAVFAPLFWLRFPGQGAVYGLMSGLERLRDPNFWYYLRMRYFSGR